MIPVAKRKLEVICRDYLNHGERVRAVDRVCLERPRIGAANWTLATVEPRFDLSDVRRSHAAIRELQTRFRMVT